MTGSGLVTRRRFEAPEPMARDPQTSGAWDLGATLVRVVASTLLMGLAVLAEPGNRLDAASAAHGSEAVRHVNPVRTAKRLSATNGSRPSNSSDPSDLAGLSDLTDPANPTRTSKNRKPQSNAAATRVTQCPLGLLVGRVIEAGSGDPVAGAVVRASGPVDASTVTAADGTWCLDGVPAGRYNVSISHVGFAGFETTFDASGGVQGTPAMKAANDPTAGANEVSDPTADAAADAGDARTLGHRAGAAAAGLEIALTPRPVSLDAVVVTAGRRRQRLADVPVATEVISRREIRETGAADVAAVLVERTGVQLQGNTPVGAGVMLQGLGSERVLVLMDGQPFIGRIAGAIDLSRLSTAMIERLEVVKGPQSTLYGSEAMGGVVNVITRRPTGAAWGAGGALTAGSQGRFDIDAHGNVRLGAVTALGDVGRRTVERVAGAPDEAGAWAERWDGLVKVRWAPEREGRPVVEGSAFFLDERQRWKGGQLFQFADNQQWAGRVGATWEWGAHRLRPALYATGFDHLSRSASAEEPVEGTGERETQRLLEAELVYDVGLGEHGLDVGVEARREVIRSDRVTGGERTAHTLEPFLQATLAWGALRLVPGARLTWSEQWGTHATPKLAALYRPAPSLALRASFGRGFREPAFKEQYMEFLNIGPGFGYTVRGNPDLGPETSRNVSAGIEWAGEHVYLRAQVFDNRFDDFIETQAVGDSSGITVFTYGNIEDGWTRGAELEAGLTWRAVRAELGYSLLRAERADTGEPLLGRPQSSGRASLAYAHPVGLRATATGVFTGETPMQRTAAGTEWRDGFLRFDLRLAQELPGGFDLSVGLDNVLDERPADWPGFTGRRFYTGLSWRHEAQ